MSSLDRAALTLIGQMPRVLRSLLADLPPEVLNTPNEEGWSLKDVVAHLHNVEGIAFAARITRMLDEERPFIRSIDPPALLETGGYASRQLDELLDELEQQRRQHVAWLQRLSSEQLERTGEHDAVGEIRVLDIAHQWAAHDMSHLRQIARMIQQHFAPLMGAARGFYDV